MEFEGSVLSQCSEKEMLTAETGGPRRRMTLHCQHCNTVLGDSLGVCGEVKSLDSILCLKVTNDVVVSKSMESGHKGDLAKCISSSLKCRCCLSAVGRIIHSAPSCLAMIRSLFLLHKANIRCYILNSGTMVKASSLTFDMMAFKENMNEMRQQFQEQLDQMSAIKNRLEYRSFSSEFDHSA